MFFFFIIEGEQSDEENDKDDADKQMGETDNAAEKQVDCKKNYTFNFINILSYIYRHFYFHLD